MTLKGSLVHTVKLHLQATALSAQLLRALEEARSVKGLSPQLLSFQQSGEEPLSLTERRLLEATPRSGVDFALLSASALPAELVELIAAALSPMTLSYRTQPCADEPGACLLIEVEPLEGELVRVTSDDPKQLERADALRGFGFTSLATQVSLSERARLSFMGASHSLRRRLLWSLQALELPSPQALIELSPPEEGEPRALLHVPSADPSTLREALQGVNIRLRGDDFEALLKMGQLLCGGDLSIGYDVTPSSAEGEDELAWFELSFGALSYHKPRCEALYVEVRRALNELGLDEERSPIKRRFETSSCGWEGSPEELLALMKAHPPVITLPLRRYHSQRLVSPEPEEQRHWQVMIYTQARGRVAPLLSSLEELGYLEPVVIEAEPRSLFAELSYPESCPEELIQELSALVSESLKLPMSPEPLLSLTLRTRAHQQLQSRSLSLSLNLDDLNPLRFRQRLSRESASCHIALKCGALSAASPLWERLEQLGAASLELKLGEGGEGEGARLFYGGAPRALVEYLQGLTELSLGLRCELVKLWDAEDMELWIQLPEGLGAREPEGLPDEEGGSAGLGSAMSDWFPPKLSALEREPFGSLSPQELRVAELLLERPRLDEARDLARVPSLSAFKGYCLDQQTSESLYHVAEAVALAEPCLLEGPTSASKTSVILYLAALLGQPVARLNLSAQTDTGELIGRYTPAEGGWAWRDGLVVEALTRGWWLILDELNLAEPQVLERLNSLLERAPSLTLSERDGRLIGAQGEPIHERFRVFATMNPAEYVGRAPLSPAYRDRWLADRMMPATSERALYEMIAARLWAEAPELSLFGAPYEGRVEGLEAQAEQGAPLRRLAALQVARPLMRALARFHASLARALSAEAAQLRVAAGETSVVSRRSLIATLDYLEAALSAQPELDEAGLELTLKRALWRYYVARLRAPELRALAHSLWLSSGLELSAREP